MYLQLLQLSLLGEMACALPSPLSVPFLVVQLVVMHVPSSFSFLLCHLCFCFRYSTKRRIGGGGALLFYRGIELVHTVSYQAKYLLVRL